MTDHYDRYGEVVARRFNYAQLRIDIWEMEMRHALKEILRDAEFELNRNKYFEEFKNSGTLVYRSEVGDAISEIGYVVNRISKSVMRLQEAQNQKHKADMFRNQICARNSLYLFNGEVQRLQICREKYNIS